MLVFAEDNQAFQQFKDQAEAIIRILSANAKETDISALTKLIDNFKVKTDDFYRENRQLNIGVVGQVKAGKSSFLNTLLFSGQEILPKAATPKTATLTKMEYSDANVINVEYYYPEEWSVLEENAAVDSEDEIYVSSREIVKTVKNNGLDPHSYLEKGSESFCFASYDELLARLNDYVGANGKFTPIVKAVTLCLNKEEFKGLSIVDTPGLNDPILSRTIRTKEFLELCDVVFFLSQSGSFLDKSDWNLLSCQLPYKGVQKLVLIASKYDSGIRDVLREQDEDDIFGEDENTASNIPQACKIIRKKLKKRAKSKVEEFIRDLQSRNSSPELIEVVRQCADPLMVSSLAYNMSGKPVASFSSEELNIYSALKRFSRDIDSDLKLLGNFDEVKKQFSAVAENKERILRQKVSGFIPIAKEELKALLASFLDKTYKRLHLLENNDKKQLEEQKQAFEKQINGIEADIDGLFSRLLSDVETAKSQCKSQLLCDTLKNNLDSIQSNIVEKERTVTTYKRQRVSDSKVYNPLSWGTSHLELQKVQKQEKYQSVNIAAAADTLMESSKNMPNTMEAVFREALDLQNIKRSICNIVVDNFDMSSEKYDYSLFRRIVEDTVGSIDLPAFSLDLSNQVLISQGLRFAEAYAAKNMSSETQGLFALFGCLANAANSYNNYNKCVKQLDDKVKELKDNLNTLHQNIKQRLISNILSEFDDLTQQCADKDREIAAYRAYADALQQELAKL